MALLTWGQDSLYQSKVSDSLCSISFCLCKNSTSPFVSSLLTNNFTYWITSMHLPLLLKTLPLTPILFQLLPFFCSFYYQKVWKEPSTLNWFYSVTVSWTVSSYCWMASITIHLPPVEYSGLTLVKVMADLGLPSPESPLCPIFPTVLRSIQRCWRLSFPLGSLWLISWFRLDFTGCSFSIPFASFSTWPPRPHLPFLDDLIKVHDFKYHFCAGGSQIYISVPTSPLSSRHIDLTWHLYLDDSRRLSPNTLGKDFSLLHHFPHLVLISVNGTTIYSVAHIKNLGLPCVHKSVLYMCVSILALQIGS